MICGCVSSIAQDVAAVRRRSCKVQPVTPLSWSSLFLDFETRKLRCRHFHAQGIRTFHSNRGIFANTSRARVDSGTRCSRWFFVTVFGIIKSRLSKSIWRHCMLLTSPRRCPVRMSSWTMTPNGKPCFGSTPKCVSILLLLKSVRVLQASKAYGSLHKD